METDDRRIESGKSDKTGQTEVRKHMESESGGREGEGTSQDAQHEARDYG